MIEGIATARYVRTSAQKAGLVMDLIRGLDVSDALARLRYSKKSVARDVSKVLRSAVANAQQKDGASVDVDRLFVGGCYANQGPSQKRVRAAPMGRAFRIIKRTSHLTVMVQERPERVAAVEAVPALEPSSKDLVEMTGSTKRSKQKTAAKAGAARKTTHSTKDAAGPAGAAAGIDKKRRKQTDEPEEG